jgi:hypothetical protein
MTYREPNPWDFAEPERLLHDIVATTPLQAYRPVLALVADAGGSCELLGATTVDVAPGTRWNEASAVLRTAAERLPLLEERETPRSSLLLVVPRPGRVVFGPTEEYWLRACRYINLLRLILGPDIVLVTEHGWRFYLQPEVGATPRLELRESLDSTAATRDRHASGATDRR